MIYYTIPNFLHQVVFVHNLLQFAIINHYPHKLTTIYKENGAKHISLSAI